MKAAIVQGTGQHPTLQDFEEPVPVSGESLVAVTAAAVSRNVKSRASGEHYSPSGPFPFVIGIDGAGRLDDGSRVYFVLPRAPFGSMAERTIVANAHCLPLPPDLDDMTAAAIANPGMSSWAALSERAQFKPGETVLVNGATGTAGRLAVQITRYRGAGRVIATGRNIDALRALHSLGADVTIPLSAEEDVLDASLKEQFTKGVDIVLDYLWGRSTERLLIAAAKYAPHAIPIRFVQIGSVSGQEIRLPGAVLRASAIDLMGSGIGSVPAERFIEAIGALLQATTSGGFRIAFKPVPLSDFDAAWPRDDSTCRTVFTVDQSGGMRCTVPRFQAGSPRTMRRRSSTGG